MNPFKSIIDIEKDFFDKIKENLLKQHAQSNLILQQHKSNSIILSGVVIHPKIEFEIIKKTDQYILKPRNKNPNLYIDNIIFDVQKLKNGEALFLSEFLMHKKIPNSDFNVTYQFERAYTRIDIQHDKYEISSKFFLRDVDKDNFKDSGISSRHSASPRSPLELPECQETIGLLDKYLDYIQTFFKTDSELCSLYLTHNNSLTHEQKETLNLMADISFSNHFFNGFCIDVNNVFQDLKTTKKNKNQNKKGA